ncbi:MAG: diacylglycerol kinase family protein [Mesorhizobium sp.]
MHFVAVLNRDGGTLKSTDLDALAQRMRKTLEDAGHSLDVHVVEGEGVLPALEKAAASRKADVVLAGGGDGTISAAAACLKGKKKALAVLPAGTMNLFARGLGIPLSLDTAVAAFAEGKIRKVDMASANDRPFVHQFSVGMHAKMVHLRERMEFGTRWGKIRATLRAAYMTLRNPTTMKVELKIGATEVLARTTGIGVSNNLFGEGHLPYADHPDAGTLGIYVTVARQPRELVRYFWQLARGRWQENDQVEIHEAEKVVLTVLSPKRRRRCVIDGELLPLDRQTTVIIHPKALNVLVPKS